MNQKRTILRCLAAIAALMLMMSAGTAALADSFKARINSASAKVYSTPSASGKNYISGGKGVTVTVTGSAGSWARISYRGNTGYIQSKYLNLVNRIKAYAGKKSYVYRDASASSGRLGTLSLGDSVYVVGMSGNYYRVQNASASMTGYVAKGSLTTRAKLESAYRTYLASLNNSSSSSGSGSNSSSNPGSAGGSTTASSKIDKAITLAKKQLGKPYAISDNPPVSFNCSSFVEYCLEACGYSVKGTAAAQAADGSMSKITSVSEMKKGDILCFDTDEDGACDHTALYLGGSKFIEASQNAGKVQENSLDSWYKAHLMFARRPK